MIISLSANGIVMTVYPVFADRLVARAFSINSCVFSFCSPGDHVLSALHTAETALQAFLNLLSRGVLHLKKNEHDTRLRSLFTLQIHGIQALPLHVV